MPLFTTPLATQQAEVKASASGSFVAQGLLITTTEQGIRFVARYVGDPGVSGEISRRRRSVYDAMRRLGSPVLVKHMFNADDVAKGIAVPSDNFDSVYGQTRNEDPLSHGIGFVSVEKADDEWVSPEGVEIVQSVTSPGAGYTPAPKYRGFGQGYIVYVIEPDVALDFFKVDSTGVLIKVQQATVQAPWFPDINDNDLLTNVILDDRLNVIDARERYQCKMVNPVSMRGRDRRGRREYAEEGGNRFVVNQTFEMSLVPDNNVLQMVEMDR